MRRTAEQALRDDLARAEKDVARTKARINKLADQSREIGKQISEAEQDLTAQEGLRDGLADALRLVTGNKAESEPEPVPEPIDLGSEIEAEPVDDDAVIEATPPKPRKR